MKFVDIVYVILHYITIEDTVKCVESIEENNKNNSYHIVIVDNGSQNNTGVLLKQKYKNFSNITVLLLEKNIGFAKGNNIGYQFCKNHFKTHFIAVLNNDIILTQNNRLNILLSKYNDNKNIAMIGPKINLSNGNCTPLYCQLPTYKSIQRRILKIYLMLLFDFFKLTSFSNYLYTTQLGKKVTETYEDKGDRKNIILHGSFVILTNTFISEFDELFDPRTFLYCEEELLYIKVRRKKMNTLYTTDICVIHNEDSATNALTITERKKRIFKNKHLLQSYKILLKELKKGGFRI